MASPPPHNRLQPPLYFTCVEHRTGRPVCLTGVLAQVLQSFRGAAATESQERPERYWPAYGHSSWKDVHRLSPLAF